MKNKILAWIFYRVFLRKTNDEMYHTIDSKGTRRPTKIGYDFYKIYNYLIA